jgi:hypothetical protein
MTRQTVRRFASLGGTTPGTVRRDGWLSACACLRVWPQIEMLYHRKE